ncbi:hypothetical protein BOX15_Mlig003175g1 [Macrostomum lignano]|uniref:VWFA domain-containing protein n=1 Tax=Macrostomum lignano TaxID=282301 RepID=A0A267GL70_9PLAT|nr:hypothetical protein BOX15_Mlig003175g1 [Macrostomum lignano]
MVLDLPNGVLTLQKKSQPKLTADAGESDGKLQASSIVDQDSLDSCFSSALARIGEVNLKESGAAVKVYLKEKKFAIACRNPQGFQVGMTGGFPKKEFFYLVCVVYEGKLSEIWHGLEVVESIELIPVFNNLQLVLLLRSKKANEQICSERLSEASDKMKQLMNYDSTFVTECVKKTKQTPFAVLSFKATMPQNWLYDFLSLTGKTFSGCLSVVSSGFSLDIECGSVELFGCVSLCFSLGLVHIKAAKESSKQTDADGKLLKKTQGITKLFLDAKMNINLPTEFLGNAKHKAEFSGRLSIESSGKKREISGTLKITGEDDLAWPTPFGLKFLTLISASMQLSISVPPDALSFEVAAAMKLFESDIEFRIRFMTRKEDLVTPTRVVPVGAYFRFQKDEEQTLRFSNLLKLLGVDEVLANNVDFLLPGFNHLFFLYLAANENMESIKFLVGQQQMTEKAVRTPEDVGGGNPEGLTERYEIGPCVKFDAAINWLGMNAKLWGGFTFHGEDKKIEFGGELVEPLKLLDLLEVSSTDGKAGPKLHLVVSKATGLKFLMDVKVSIFFIIEVAAKIETDTAKKCFYARFKVTFFKIISVEVMLNFGERENQRRFLDWDIRLNSTFSIKKLIKEIISSVRKLLKKLEQKMDDSIKKMREKVESNSGIKWLFYQFCQVLLQLARAATHAIIKGVDFVQSAICGIDAYEKEIENETELDSREKNPMKKLVISGGKEDGTEAATVVSYSANINNKDASGAFRFALSSTTKEEDLRKELKSAIANSYADRFSLDEGGGSDPQPTESDLAGPRGEEIKKWMDKVQNAKEAIADAEKSGLTESPPPSMGTDEQIMGQSEAKDSSTGGYGSGQTESADPLGSGTNKSGSGQTESTDPSGSGTNESGSGQTESADPLGSGTNESGSGQTESTDPSGSGTNESGSGQTESADPSGSGTERSESGGTAPKDESSAEELLEHKDSDSSCVESSPNSDPLETSDEQSQSVEEAGAAESRSEQREQEGEVGSYSEKTNKNETSRDVESAKDSQEESETDQLQTEEETFAPNDSEPTEKEKQAGQNTESKSPSDTNQTSDINDKERKESRETDQSEMKPPNAEESEAATEPDEKSTEETKPTEASKGASAQEETAKSEAFGAALKAPIPTDSFPEETAEGKPDSTFMSEHAQKIEKEGNPASAAEGPSAASTTATNFEESDAADSSFDPLRGHLGHLSDASIVEGAVGGDISTEIATGRVMKFSPRSNVDAELEVGMQEFSAGIDDSDNEASTAGTFVEISHPHVPIHSRRSYRRPAQRPPQESSIFTADPSNWFQVQHLTSFSTVSKETRVHKDANLKKETRGTILIDTKCSLWKKQNNGRKENELTRAVFRVVRHSEMHNCKVQIVLTGDKSVQISNEGFMSLANVPATIKDFNTPWMPHTCRKVFHKLHCHSDELLATDSKILDCQWVILITDQHRGFGSQLFQDSLQQFSGEIYSALWIEEDWCLKYGRIERSGPENPFVAAPETEELSFITNAANAQVVQSQPDPCGQFVPEPRQDVLEEWLECENKGYDLGLNKEQITTQYHEYENLSGEVANLSMPEMRRYLTELSDVTGIHAADEMWKKLAAKVDPCTNRIISSIQVSNQHSRMRYHLANRGKKLSIRGLMNWFMTNGTSNKIWLQRHRVTERRIAVGIAVSLTSSTVSSRPMLLHSLVSLAEALDHQHVSTCCVTFSQSVSVVKTAGVGWSPADKARLLGSVTNCEAPDPNQAASADGPALTALLQLLLRDPSGQRHVLVFTDAGLGSFSPSAVASFEAKATARRVRCWAFGVGPSGLSVSQYGLSRSVSLEGLGGLPAAMRQVFDARDPRELAEAAAQEEPAQHPAATASQELPLLPCEDCAKVERKRYAVDEPEGEQAPRDQYLSVHFDYIAGSEEGESVQMEDCIETIIFWVDPIVLLLMKQPTEAQQLPMKDRLRLASLEYWVAKFALFMSMNNAPPGIAQRKAVFFLDSDELMGILINQDDEQRQQPIVHPARIAAAWAELERRKREERRE